MRTIYIKNTGKGLAKDIHFDVEAADRDNSENRDLKAIVEGLQKLQGTMLGPNEPKPVATTPGSRVATSMLEHVYIRSLTYADQRGKVFPYEGLANALRPKS